MHSDRVMTPEHPLWNEFVEKLSRALVCAHTTDNARLLLASMEGIDVQRSLDALWKRRGRCDCEIVYEVARLEPAHA
jgi:hypothetical protein